MTDQQAKELSICAAETRLFAANNWAWKELKNYTNKRVNRYVKAFGWKWLLDNEMNFEFRTCLNDIVNFSTRRGINLYIAALPHRVIKLMLDHAYGLK